MKNMLTLIVLLSSWLTVYSQESYTETELKQKCDSIVEEANTLYRYETAAWNFTDMIFAKPGLIETIQNILTYHQGDSIKCVAIDKQSYCIYEATFLNESAPCSEVTTRRNLTEQEILLAKIKEKIRSELADHEKYPIYRYDNHLQMDINSMLFQEYLKGVPYLSAMITYLLLIKKEKFNRGRNFIPDLFRWKLQNKCR